MSNAHSIKEGFARLREVADTMQRKTYNQGIAKANRAVQTTMRGLIKQGKHVRSKTLLRSIRSKVLRYQKSKTVLGLVGVQSNFVGTWGTGYNKHKVVAHKIAHFVTNYRRQFLQKFRYGYRVVGEHQPDDFVQKTEAIIAKVAVSAIEGSINAAINSSKR